MPAASTSSNITLSRLCWSTPDGTALFTDLDLVFRAERTGLVGANGTGKTTLLHLIAGALQPRAGSIHAPAMLAMLHQDTGAHPGQTIADLFGATPARALLARAESGRAGAEELTRADWSLPARIEAALLRCGLTTGPQTVLSTLSGGQRTRAGLAALIFQAPGFLLLDEPTNNLDPAGRQLVIDLMHNWRGGAIVVSHDRDLLEGMDAIVEITSLGVTRYGGGYSAFRAQKARALQAARDDLAHSEKARHEAAQRARQALERKSRKDSAGKKARAKGGQPKVLLDAAKGRAEASGGANARLRDARRTAVEDALADARARIEVLEPVRMDIPQTGLPSGRQVLRLQGVSGGHDPAQPVIRDLSLSVTGPQRLAVTGANGSGKTTLLALITGALPPLAGTVDLSVPCALLDQHVSLLDPALSLRENYHRLNPDADDNQCRAALARFRFRADDALRQTGTLSGGQRLRAGMACTLGRPVPPALLLLDEPTNHLDLDATEALEAALLAYDGALLVVSHDAAFLSRLTLDRQLELRPDHALSSGGVQ